MGGLAAFMTETCVAHKTVQNSHSCILSQIEGSVIQVVTDLNFGWILPAYSTAKFTLQSQAGLRAVLRFSSILNLSTAGGHARVRYDLDFIVFL